MTKQEFRKQLKEVGVEYNKYRISCYEKQLEPVEFHKYIFTDILVDMPIEEEKVEQWSADKLELGDDYWIIDANGVVEEANWGYDEIDIFRLKAGIIYQTEELAQEAYNKIINS